MKRHLWVIEMKLEHAKRPRWEPSEWNDYVRSEARTALKDIKANADGLNERYRIVKYVPSIWPVLP